MNGEMKKLKRQRATKSVNGFKNYSYQERLARLNLPTLAFRRLRNDMIEIYKHFKVYDKETITPTFQPRTRPSRSHNRMLIPPIARDGIRGPSIQFVLLLISDNLEYSSKGCTNSTIGLFIQTSPGFGLERQSTQISFNII